MEEIKVESLSWNDLDLKFIQGYILVKIGCHTASFKDQKSIDQIIDFLRKHKQKLITNPHSSER